MRRLRACLAFISLKRSKSVTRAALAAGQLLSPGGRLPLLRNLGRVPRLLHASSACRMTDLDHVLGEVELLEGHHLALDAGVRPVNKGTVLIDDVDDHRQLALLGTKGNVCHTANLDKAVEHHFY